MREAFTSNRRLTVKLLSASIVLIAVIISGIIAYSHVSAGEKAGPIAQADPYSGDFSARYHFTAESVYQDIVINQSKIYYTYFDISSKNIDVNNVRQEPMWSESDLKTVEASLSEDDVRGLINIIDRAGFMSMNDTYGGGSPYERFYPYTITVRANGTEKQVIYKSFMGASPMPEEFKEVRDYMRGLVRERLSDYARYLSSDEVAEYITVTPTPTAYATIPYYLTHNNTTTVRPITLNPTAGTPGVGVR